jgi:hypothetical protein
MKRHTETLFLAWASDAGIVLDPRYPQSASLVFGENHSYDRFWCIPPEPERRPCFFRCILQAFGAWSSFRCWRHLGSWPSDPDPLRVNDQVEHTILSGLALPVGTADIVEFSHDEEVALITLLLSTSIFGWSVGEDLYLVPDSAAGILQTDHHEVVHASFRSEAMMTTFIQFMESEGFSLPDEPPDSTFKVPDWMPAA